MADCKKGGYKFSFDNLTENIESAIYQGISGLAFSTARLPVCGYRYAGRTFLGLENVTISVYDDLSRFGYKIDTSDPSAIYNAADFSSEVISEFAEFING